MKPRTRLEGIIADAMARAEANPPRSRFILSDSTAPAKRFPVAGPVDMAVLASLASQGRPGPAAALLEDRTPGGNKTERAYGAYLDQLVTLGQVARWWWQPGSFRLATVQTEKGTTSDFYRPDFLVQLPSGLLEIHETKGLMRDDARTKLKVFASIYPYPVVIIRRIKGTFQATRYARGSV